MAAEVGSTSKIPKLCYGTVSTKPRGGSITVRFAIQPKKRFTFLVMLFSIFSWFEFIKVFVSIDGMVVLFVQQTFAAATKSEINPPRSGSITVTTNPKMVGINCCFYLPFLVTLQKETKIKGKFRIKLTKLI